MLHFWHGEDTYSLSRKLQKQIQQAKDDGVSVEEVMLDDVSSDDELLGRVRDTFLSQGLFSQKKLVIIRSILTNIKKYEKTEKFILEILKGKQAVPDTVDIFFVEEEKVDKRLKLYKALAKDAKVEEFTIPTGAKLLTWIKQRVKDEGFVMDDEAVQAFAGQMLTEDDQQVYTLWQIANELEKLMLYRWEEKKISADDVSELVQGNISSNIFTLTNALADGKHEKAHRLFEQMLGEGSVFEQRTRALQVVGALASQLHSIRIMHMLSGEPVKKIAHTLEWKEGRVWINQKLARKFQPEKIKTLIRDLAAIDKRMKTSEEPVKLLLTFFIQKARVS